MVQLWVNLPAEKKLSAPRYQGLLGTEIPTISLGETAMLRLIAGEYRGSRGLAETATPVNVWDVQFHGSGDLQLELPEGHTALVLVQNGNVRIDGTELKTGELAELTREGSRLPLQAEASSRILVLTGEPIGEPVVGQGPFEMNRREEIRDAIADYQAGRMGTLSVRGTRKD